MVWKLPSTSSLGKASPRITQGSKVAVYRPQVRPLGQTPEGGPAVGGGGPSRVRPGPWVGRPSCTSGRCGKEACAPGVGSGPAPSPSCTSDPWSLGPGLARHGGTTGLSLCRPQGPRCLPVNVSPGSKSEARTWWLPMARVLGSRSRVGRPQGCALCLAPTGWAGREASCSCEPNREGSRDPRPLGPLVSLPQPLAPPPGLCPPSLQLLDAHHEVEVALRVLLDDVPHVIRLPCLLWPEDTSYSPHCALPARHSAEGVGTPCGGTGSACAIPRGSHAWLGCQGLGGPGQAAGLAGPQLPVHASDPSGPPGPLLTQVGELAQPGVQGAARPPHAGWEGTAVGSRLLPRPQADPQPLTSRRAHCPLGGRGSPCTPPRQPPPLGRGNPRGQPQSTGPALGDRDAEF